MTMQIDDRHHSQTPNKLQMDREEFKFKLHLRLPCATGRATKRRQPPSSA
jgi:hypothetical protein